MTITELFNLDLGEKHPGARFGEFRVGPFMVKVVDDYAARVREVPHRARRTDSYDSKTNQTTTSFQEATGAGWHVTATATLVGARESSLLTEPPTEDGGLWDLCVLLTFLTGRRVAMREDLDRFSPRPGEPACLDVATLLTAAAAWSGRSRIVERGLTTALNLYTEAVGHDVLQVFGSLYNTALNVVLDEWDLPLTNVAPSARKALKDTVLPVIATCEALSPEERSGYAARVGATIDQGLVGLADKLPALLVALGVIPVGDVEDATRRRVRFVNTVRNRLTHAGEGPKLRGLDKDQADRHTTAIASGVVPDILKLALGEVLELDPDGFGIHPGVRPNLVRFFAKGIWRGWPLEEKAFDEWFRADRLSW